MCVCVHACAERGKIRVAGGAGGLMHKLGMWMYEGEMWMCVCGGGGECVYVCVMCVGGGVQKNKGAGAWDAKDRPGDPERMYCGETKKGEKIV